jgi:hypothetical protein
MSDIDQTLTEQTALPIPDRLRVVESFRDSMKDNAPVEVFPDQRAELRRRISWVEEVPLAELAASQESGEVTNAVVLFGG